MTNEINIDQVKAEGPSDLSGEGGESRGPTNKEEQHVVFFSGIRTIQHHMKQYPAFKVDQPAQASGIQWFWDKRGGYIQSVMQRCFDAKKRCKIWVYYRYPVDSLDKQILGEAYQAEEYAEPY